MPLIILLASGMIWLYSGINSVLLCVGLLKVMEYSVSSAAGELIYMPMSREDRLLGKEVVRFFGHRLGKTFSSLFISLAAGYVQPSLQSFAIWIGMSSAIWFGATLALAAHLRTQLCSRARIIGTNEKPLEGKLPGDRKQEGEGGRGNDEDGDSETTSESEDGTDFPLMSMNGSEELPPDAQKGVESYGQAEGRSNQAQSGNAATVDTVKNGLRKRTRRDLSDATVSTQSKLEHDYVATTPRVGTLVRVGSVIESLGAIVDRYAASRSRTSTPK